jgi:hypothetical protein
MGDERRLHAPDVDAMDPTSLTDVVAEDMPHLTFAVDPSVSYLESRGRSIGSGAPTRTAWPATQSTWPRAASGSRFGVPATSRPLHALDPADYALRTALLGGDTLEGAATAALGVDPHFNLTTALHALLSERIFTRFAVSN